MTEIRVDRIVDSSGSGPVDFEAGTFSVGGTSLASLSLNKFMDSDYGPADSADHLAAPANRRYLGALWYDSANEHLNIMTPVGWRTFNNANVPETPSNAGEYYGDTGVHMRGNSWGNSPYNHIDQFVISTPGNATDWGDLQTSANSSNSDFVACSGNSGARCVVLFGNHGGSRLGRVEAFNFASGASGTGTSSLVGNIFRGCYGGSVTSDGNRGVATWGHDFETYNYPVSNTMEYMAIASFSSFTDFGDLRRSIAYQNNGVISDGTIGCFAGGSTGWPNFYSDIEYLTIQTTGNSTDFGDMTYSTWTSCGTSDETYGLVAGGWASPGRSDVINYFTIQSPGNATDFGDMQMARDYMSATANRTKGVLTGGYFYDAYASPNQGSDTRIDYVTISTPANATDFGDLTEPSSRGTSSSGT